MRKKSVFLLGFILLVSLVAGAADRSGPPRYLWIQVEQVHPGQTLAYMQMGQMFRQTVGAAPHYWLAGAPMVATGDAMAMVYVAFVDDFAGLQRMDADFNKIGEEMFKKNAGMVSEGMAAVASSGSVIAEFQPDLSLNVDKIDAAHTTHWVVTTYRLRPGTKAKFTQLLGRVREIESAHGNSIPLMVYAVVLGEPGPVFQLIRPLQSLAELDREPAAPENTTQAAILGEHFAAAVSECVLSQSEALYRVMPTLSHPPENYVAANPDFWNMKLPEYLAATPAKKGKKVIEPAALKEKEKEKK